MTNVYQDSAMRQVLSRLVRSQMDLNGMTYKSLCAEIKKRFNIDHNPDTLRNKVSTGALGTQMFFFMMLALDAEHVDMQMVQKMYCKIKSESTSA